MKKNNQIIFLSLFLFLYLLCACKKNEEEPASTPNPTPAATSDFLKLGSQTVNLSSGDVI